MQELKRLIEEYGELKARADIALFSVPDFEYVGIAKQRDESLARILAFFASQQERIEALRGALLPFATISPFNDSLDDTAPFNCYVRAGEVRKAAAAIKLSEAT